MTLAVLAVVAVPVMPSSAATAVYPVRITIGSLSPVTPGPGDTVTLTGALVNTTDRQLTGAHLGVRVNGGGDIPGHTEQVAPLTPGESLPFTIRVPVTSLRLGGPGDYPLAVALTGGDDALLGLSRTRLPWSPPDAGAKPLNVAVIWPVTDTPHMEAVALGTGGVAQPVFRDDTLAEDLGKGGRLQQIVGAGDGLPVTWMVDPGLLDEAKAMAGGYRVADTLDSGDPQDSRPGEGSAAASAWLAAIRAAVRDRTVATLPYADPDLAALAHTGTDGGALGSVLRQAVRWGGAVAENVLRVPVRDDVAWPYGGALDTGITGLAESLGTTTFIASGQGLSTGVSLPRVALGAGRTALVGDSAIGGALSGPLSGDGDVLAARQEILGALLSARGRSPDGSGGLIVVPPRQMSAPAARVLARALDVARSAGWVKLVGLDEVAPGKQDLPAARVGREGAGEEEVPGANGQAAGRPSGQAGGRHLGRTYRPEGRVSGADGQVAGGATGQGESYPQALRAGELTADDLTAVTAIQPDLGTLSQVLSDPARTTDAVHRAMLRAVSTGWRVEAAGGAVDDRRSYTGGVRAYVDNSITSVHLMLKHGTVTMAGDSASIPVTVANGLQQRLGGLELRVTSSAPDRVTVDNPVTAVRAPAAANHTGQVRVRAHANGPVEITAQLYTAANGRPWGTPTTFRVQVSRISPLVVAVIAGGVLLVLTAGAVKVRRTARRKAAAQDSGAGPG